jgi:hypothetical protein
VKITHRACFVKEPHLPLIFVNGSMLVIRWLALSVSVLVACSAYGAQAADLPSYTPKAKAKIAKVVPAKPKKVTQKAAQTVNLAGDVQLSVAPKAFEANADGDKQEDSASLIRKLAVPKKSRGYRSDMRVTITGHIIKTSGSTARVDVSAGAAKHSFTWPADEEKSGKFNISFNYTMPQGNLPAMVPLSAIAFVTKEKKAAVVLVTIDKIDIVFSDTRVATKSSGQRLE